MKLTKEECLELGRQYILNHKEYPAAKKWVIGSAGCNRDRIYENWGSWIPFINELKLTATIPEIKTCNPLRYTDAALIDYVHRSASNNNGFPKYSDFVSTDYPSVSALQARFGSWSAALEKAGYKRVYKYETSGQELSLLAALTMCFDKYNYVIPENTKGITKEKLLEFLASRQASSRGALGYSADGWNTFINKVFTDKPKYVNYYGWLLLKENLKFCPSCECVKTLSNFTKNSSCIDNYTGYCKKCYIPFGKVSSANRRAAKLQATPKWANTHKIQNIYDNCPEGYHVDHIVPLQGKYVCGLHVENNLQYLSASENITKRNSYESDLC